MSWVIVRSPGAVQAPSMTWEDESLVERLLRLFRSRAATPPESEAQRRRSNRMRYFVTLFGATHWADRVDGRRIPVARRGHIAL
jgi:hypothetical protein